MSRVILIVLAFLCGGCAAPVRRMTELHIDPSFLLHEQEAFVQAVDAVCEAGGPCIPVYIGRSKEQWIRRSDECPRNARTLLRWHRRPRIQYCKGDPYKMLLHELGHALSGRSDHLGPGNVMHDDVESEHLTEADLRYINSHRKETQ